MPDQAIRRSMLGGIGCYSQIVCAGVFRIITGMTSVHDLVPAEVGVKRITRSTQESGLTVVGKGLLIRGNQYRQG